MMMISVPEPTSTASSDATSSATAQFLVLLWWREGLAVAVDSREAAARMQRDLKETILSVFVDWFWYKMQYKKLGIKT